MCKNANELLRKFFKRISIYVLTIHTKRDKIRMYQGGEQDGSEQTDRSDDQRPRV